MSMVRHHAIGGSHAAMSSRHRAASCATSEPTMSATARAKRHASRPTASQTISKFEAQRDGTAVAPKADRR